MTSSIVIGKKKPEQKKVTQKIKQNFALARYKVLLAKPDTMQFFSPVFLPPMNFTFDAINFFFIVGFSLCFLFFPPTILLKFFSLTFD